MNHPETVAAWDEFVGASSDIGVDKWKDCNPKQLDQYLGYVHGLPYTFRRWMVADTKESPPVKVKIDWHQKVYVATVLDKMDKPRLADRGSNSANDEDYQCVKENWGAVPAIGLFDQVGLGKTMCAMATIGTLQNCYLSRNRDRKRGDDLPECMRGKS